MGRIVKQRQGAGKENLRFPDPGTDDPTGCVVAPEIDLAPWRKARSMKHEILNQTAALGRGKRAMEEEMAFLGRLRTSEDVNPAPRKLSLLEIVAWKTGGNPV
jgi:hypothetical protein